MDFRKLTKKQLIDEIENLLGEKRPASKQKTNSIKQTALELSAVERNFNRLFENSRDMLFTISPNGEVLWVNNRGARSLGYKQSELIGKSVWVVVDKADIPKVKQRIGYIIAKRKKYSELYFSKVKKDGTKIFVHERTQLVFDSIGEISGIRIICRDITKARLAEDALKKGEEKYRLLANNINVGIYRSTIDPDGKLLDFNPAFMRLFGYKRKKELYENSAMSLYAYPEDRKELIRTIEKKGSVRNREIHFVKKDGTLFLGSISGVISKDKSGEVKYYGGIIEDVTLKKRAEEALQKSENKYRTLVESFNDIIFITDYDSKMLYANPSLKKQTGLSIDNFQMPQKENPFIYSEDAERIGRFIARFIKSRKQHSDIIENRFIDRSGNIHWYSSIITKIEFMNLPALQFIVRDVTRQKEALEQIRKREEQYRTLFNFSPQGILLEDSQGNIIDVNPAFCKMLGYAKKDLIGKNVHILSHQSTLEQVELNIARIMKGKLLRHVVNSVKKDGTKILVKLNEKKLLLPEGGTGIICIAENITDKELARINLVNSEESYRGLFNSSTDAIYVQDSKGHFLAVNDGAVKMYGYAKNYFLGKTPEFLSAPGMNDMFKTFEKIQKAFKGKPQTFDFWGIDKKGRVFPKEVRINKGKYFGQDVVITFAQDITERKAFQEKLQENQRRLSTLMGNLPGMAYRCANDPNWTMEFVSEGCFELTGYKTIDLINNRKISYNNLIHPDDQKMVWDTVQEGVSKFKPYRIIYRIITKKGIPKWVWEQGTGVFDRNMNLLALEGFISNITEQKIAEEELRKLSRSVEQSPTIVVITDLEGKIEYVNPKFTQVTGYGLNEVLGKNPRILKSGSTPEETYLALWQSVVSGQEWSGEFINRKKSGEVYWEWANIFPLKDDKGRITHFIAMKEDITIRKKMEQDLIKAKEKAEESDKLKSAFLANMSHEIRTPMNAIIGFSQLLSEPDVTAEEQNHYISLIQKSGGDLLSLIDDIIDISKIEAGQLKIFKADYFIDTVLTEIYDTYIEYLKTAETKKEIKFIYNNSASLKKLVVHTDIDKLKQVIRNLINNAIKFTDHGLIEFGAQLINEGRESWIQFYVRDTGIGIPADKFDIIFESFRQLDINSKRLYGGTGLGLAITKKIVELLGGNIWVKSLPNQGSTFYFRLPYNPSLIDGSIPGTKIMSYIPRKFDWGKKNILIVEDDEQSFLFYQNVLKKTGINITQAPDGAAAIDYCDRQKFDVILMDIRMPKMDGYQTSQKILTNHPGSKIIAQTAYAMAGEKQRCLNAGCVDYISKPISIAAFLEVIEKHI